MKSFESGGVFNPGLTSQWSQNVGSLARYPAPFFDYASTQIPKTVEGMWYWCSYYAICNPYVSAALARKASYPVTDLVVQHNSDQVAEAWDTLLDDSLAIDNVRLTFNMDLYTYGRAAISVFPPFRKFFICTKCQRRYSADAIRYSIDPVKKSFRVHCPTCQVQSAQVVDIVLPSDNGFSIRRWAPKELVCKKLGFLDKKMYLVTPSKRIVNQIKRGVRSAINNTPQEIVEAILRGRPIGIREDRIFVRTEDGTSLPFDDETDTIWPFGSLAATLKECYHLQIAYKNEEVNLVTQMIPFKAVSPVEPRNPAAQLFSQGVYGEWEALVKREYEKFQADPGYLSVLPVPMQSVQTQTSPSPMLPSDPMYQRIGSVLTGIRVPQSLVVEGAPWSGAVPNLKLFEKDAKGNQNTQNDLVRFVVREANRLLRWPIPETSLGTLMSVDAIQKVSVYSGLVQAGNLDRQTFHETVLGEDHKRIEARLEEEQERRIGQQIKDERRMADERARQLIENNKIQSESQQQQQAAAASPVDPGAEVPVEGQEGEVPPQGVPGPESVPTVPTSGLPTTAQLSATSENQPMSDGVTQGLTGSYLTVDSIMSSLPPNPGPDAAQKIVEVLPYQSPADRSMLLAEIARKYPELSRMVTSTLSGGADRDLPDLLPPRRSV